MSNPFDETLYGAGPKHNDCGTTECCGGCSTNDDSERSTGGGCGMEGCCGSILECSGAPEPKEETISLKDASMEQTREAAIDLMVNVMGIRQDLFQHMEILQIVSTQLDELGATDEDMADMTAEALKRFGVPEDMIAEAAKLAAGDDPLLELSADKPL